MNDQLLQAVRKATADLSDALDNSSFSLFCTSVTCTADGTIIVVNESGQIRTFSL